MPRSVKKGRWGAPEKAALDALGPRLRAFGDALIEEGWRPEMVVFAPEEIGRLPGFKVALIVPLPSGQENE